MKNNLYELSILVNGRPIREYGHKGLTFVEGRKKQNYTIRFRNNSALRVMAVVSVDGIGIIDGKPATSESRGYIVPGCSSAEFDGWRTSLSSVNQFVFNSKSDSYSAITQTTDRNCGVVSVKVFAENMTEMMRKIAEEIRRKAPEWHTHYHYPAPDKPWADSTGNPMMSPYMTVSDDGSLDLGTPLRSSAPDVSYQASSESALSTSQNAGFNLGTSWGEEKTSVVTEVSFERGMEVAMLTIYYTNAKGLKKAGIDVTKGAAISKPSNLPMGFNGFCTPPGLKR